MYSSAKSAEKWFKHFHLILKLFGLACYSKSDQKGRCIKSTIFDKIIFVATLCLWIFLTLYQIRFKMIMEESVEDKQKFFFDLWLDFYILQIFFVIIIVSSSFWYRNKIETLFHIFGDFDEKVKRFNWKTKSAEKLYRKAVLLFLLHVFLAMVCFAASVTGKWPIDSNGLVNALNDCFVMLFYAVASEQFFVTVYEIHNRLNVLNNNLR